MIQLTYWSLFPAFTVLACVALYLRIRNRQHVPGVNALLLVLTASGLWATGQLLESLATERVAKQMAVDLTTISIAIIPVAWFAFAIAYAKRQHKLTRATLNAICALPAITILIVATGTLHNLGVVEVVLVNDPRSGYIGSKLSYLPWFFVHAAYSYALIISATAVLAFVLSMSGMGWRPVTAVILAPSVVLMTNAFYWTEWNPLPFYNYTPLALVLSAAILYAGVIKVGLLDTLPVVRDRVFGKLGDPVFVVDNRQNIIDANPAASELMYASREALLHTSIAHIIKRWPHTALSANHQATAEVALDTRTFHVSFTQLDEHRDADVALLFRDITTRREDEERLRSMQRELRHLAHTDGLTGLYNRRYFMQRLNEEVARVQRHGSLLSVLLFDLDHFKAINDTHGHDTGDEVLVAVAESANEVKRVTDVAGRLGGEEFGILLPETDQDGALFLADRLRAAIEALTVTSDTGETVRVTASIGVATAGREAELVLSYADKALYAAKNRGRNQVQALTL